MRPLVVALLMLAGTLAGCAQEDPEPGPAAPVADGPALSGVVVDAALRPLADIEIAVSAGNASLAGKNGTGPPSTMTVQSDAEGGYAFEDVPRDVPLLVTASAPGFETASRTTSVPAGTVVRLNITLQAVPEVRAYKEVQKFEGFLPCQVRTSQDGQGSTTECGALVAQERLDIWEFSVSPDLAGIVLEVVWEPSTAASTILNLTVETVGFGDSDRVLASVEGPSVLKAQVAQAHAKQFYGAGGIVRATVSVGSEADEEAGTSAGAAFQQDFQVFATTFYHEPPPATYTVTE